MVSYLFTRRLHWHNEKTVLSLSGHSFRIVFVAPVFAGRWCGTVRPTNCWV